MKTSAITMERINLEKRVAAKELLRMGFAIRTVERMTDLPYITVYRLANPGKKV